LLRRPRAASILSVLFFEEKKERTGKVYKKTLFLNTLGALNEPVPHPFQKIEDFLDQGWGKKGGSF
jgi:hypothetical protein